MEQKGLKKGALGLLDTLNMAVAGSAPAYSITATSATLIAAVGLAGPAALLYAFFPMIGITVSFAYLNQWRSDAGAAYSWVGRSLHPTLGFISGWALLSLSTIFTVAAALPAGEATLELIAPQHLHKVNWAVGIGALWFLAVLAIITIGIKATAKVQLFLTVVEVAGLVLIGVLAIVHSWGNPIAQPSWEWFSLRSFMSFDAFSAGMLIAVFYYFGWDVSANLAEETSNAKKAAGLGGILGVVTIVLIFLLLQVAIQMTLTADEIQSNSANLFPFLGRVVLSSPFSGIAVIVVMFSTIATMETQLLQVTRLLFSMSRDRVISEPLGRLHPRFNTPWLAGFAAAFVALILMAASVSISSISQLMKNLIDAIGVQVSFYYAMAGIACAYYHRKVLLLNWRLFLFAGLLPFLSALVVGVIGIFQLFRLEFVTAVLSLSTLAAGFIPLYYYRWKYKSHFYTTNLEHGIKDNF